MSRRLIVTGGSRDRELVLVDTLIVGRDPGVRHQRNQRSVAVAAARRL